MEGLAYLFERFPSFTQTFCYREVAELSRQAGEPPIFSIRQTTNEPVQKWDAKIVQRVTYLPDDEALVREVDRALRRGKLPAAVTAEIGAWARKTDFLRLYQAAWLGPRLLELGVRHLHVHFAGMAARTAWWIERFFGIGFSFTAHANDIFAPKDFEISLPKLVERSRAVVTVSDFGVRYLAANFPEAATKLHRVYNGIDLARYRRADFREAPPLILSVGRLIEKKGFADLIEACRLLRERGISFRCEIIGEGPLANHLVAQIANAALADSVVLAGPQSQEVVIDQLARSAVFALPCVTEAAGGMDNLPTVIMEAMAAGLPVISTPVAGVPEMVENQATGLLVGEHQPAALAEALARILTDDTLRRSLGEAGYSRAESLFSIRQSARDLLNLFQAFVS